MATIFISYRREDSAGYAGRLHEELEERLGADRVFRDVDTLRPGQDFVLAIEERLRECRVFIALIGPGWLTNRDSSGGRRIDGADDYVRLEIAAALVRPDALVLPVLVGGAVMPPSAQLPENIRPLGRRQAVTLRDEAWEVDVDRLASAIAGDLGDSGNTGGRARRPRRAPLLATAGLALLLLLGIGWTVRSRPGTAPSGPSAGAVTDARGDAGTSVIVHAIEIPRMSEIAHGDLIYTLLSGSLRPGQGRSTLWLRFRVSNEGAPPANLWDQSFRVAAGGEEVPASGGLNELLDGHSIQQQVVRFDIPSGHARALLRVTYGGRTGELSLDLASTGSPPKHDEPDPADALSRADMRALVRDPMALVGTGDLRATLTRATLRRFVNTLRLNLSIRLENRGPVAVFSGDLRLRLAAGGSVLAPVSVTSAAIEPGSTLEADAVFEVPPATTTAVLQGSAGTATGEVPLMLR